ncbi:VOC family protein [Hymenobacter sp. GOD-10R]|uniref:VOC family protein n=1 Tax=Hymenobacter sp. GOD-10R TaxID=3093922 RepID=UPI002D7737D2|nr:VOC family protein [Hymenobacter sp. GOD-10R]WRQ30701.1 VOC family protein [Hymenobacter sp. GOD-10R]
MTTQLGFVSLQVSNLDASRQFYTEVLGFEPLATGQPDACVFATQSGAVFAIRKPLVDLQAADRLGWGVGLWFNVTHLDEFLHRIHGQATLVRGIQATPFGNTAVIADPDGYTLTLLEVPAQ